MNTARINSLFRFAMVLLSLPFAPLASAQDDKLPNIILCMGDDHGWEETGYNGHPHLKTPVLDEMAATGLRFDHFYAAHPTCSPTRGSVLTGRHPNRYGTFTPNFSFRDPGETGRELSAITRIQRIYREHGFRQHSSGWGRTRRFSCFVDMPRSLVLPFRDC